MNSFKVQISPIISQEMHSSHEDCGAEDSAYGVIFANDFAPGVYEVSEDAVNEFQSWSAFALGSLLQWMEYEPGVYTGEYRSMLAFYKQTIKLIGLRHHIG